MTLAQARAAVAAACTTVDGVTCRARGPVKVPKAGDGWVVGGRIAPADYTRCAATVTALIVLGPDQARADALLDDWAVPLINAVTAGLLATDVSVEPQLLLQAGENQASLYALALTLTLEVE